MLKPRLPGLCMGTRLVCNKKINTFKEESFLEEKSPL